MQSIFKKRLGLLMKKLLAVLLFIGVSFLSADDEDFSYTYFDLSAVQADDTGYDATVSLGLPFSLYLLFWHQFKSNKKE